MLSFRYFTELFNTKVRWKWTRQDNRPPSEWAAEFITPLDLHYVVRLRSYSSYRDGDRDQAAGPDVCWWNIDFYLSEDSMQAIGKDQNDPGQYTSEYGVLGTGEATVVFATVIEILQDFLRSHPDIIIRFVAAEASRIKLYDRFMKQTEHAIPGYTFTKRRHGMMCYVLHPVGTTAPDVVLDW